MKKCAKRLRRQEEKNSTSEATCTLYRVRGNDFIRILVVRLCSSLRLISWNKEALCGMRTWTYGIQRWCDTRMSTSLERCREISSSCFSNERKNEIVHCCCTSTPSCWRFNGSGRCETLAFLLFANTPKKLPDGRMPAHCWSLNI